MPRKKDQTLQLDDVFSQPFHFFMSKVMWLVAPLSMYHERPFKTLGQEK